MELPVIDARPDDAIPVTCLDANGLAEWRKGRSDAVNAWLDTQRFNAAPGTHCVLPGADGHPERVLAGSRSDEPLGAIAGLGAALAGVTLYLDPAPDGDAAHLAALGFALGTYRFERYGKERPEPARLVLPSGVNRAKLAAEVAATCLTRDLINTPAADMMPEHLAAAARDLAGQHGARFSETVGDELLTSGYPTIHAVGRASASPPRLIEIEWGRPEDLPVTIIGKGVCFDSGGLDIKSATGMRLMKKDMGGAAQALGVAAQLMANAVPVHLRVLIPAVENAISGNAFRPGDVITTRAGKTVEVDNTDAEGRLVLCDALALACESPPSMIVDFATLTGAARVALGTDLPAMFCNDDALAGDLLQAGKSVADPVWRLPLHMPYRSMLDSNIADMANSGSTPYGGAITAALFLSEFVDDDVPWAHFDLMAWNLRGRPGRPEGGEAMAIRAVCRAIEARIGAG